MQKRQEEWEERKKNQELQSSEWRKKQEEFLQRLEINKKKQLEFKEKLLSSVNGQQDFLRRLKSRLESQESFIAKLKEQIDELERVLRYPKLKKYFSEEAIIDILKFVSEKSNVVSIKRIIQDCRDPEDNYILDIGTQFHLDYIITGDEDLLALHPYKKIQVIKIAKFIEMAL